MFFFFCVLNRWRVKGIEKFNPTLIQVDGGRHFGPPTVYNTWSYLIQLNLDATISFSDLRTASDGGPVEERRSEAILMLGGEINFCLANAAAQLLSLPGVINNFRLHLLSD